MRENLFDVCLFSTVQQSFYCIFGAMEEPFSTFLAMQFRVRQ